MNDNKNFIAVILISLAILMGWNYFYEQPMLQKYQQSVAAQQAAPQSRSPSQPVSAEAPVAVPKPRTAIIAAGFSAGERIAITTPRLHGSINLRGGRIDDLTLADYRETIAPNSPEIVLLSPSATAEPYRAYYADFGWLAGDTSASPPGADSVWHTDAKNLSVGQPVTLRWDNGKGLTFERKIEIDDNYMFTVTDSVKNASGHAVTLYPYGSVTRVGSPLLVNASRYDEAIGVFDGSLDEEKYKTLIESHEIDRNSTNGWLGFTDQYWLVAMAPVSKESTMMRFVDQPPATGGSMLSPGQPGVSDKFQADYRGGAVILESGANLSASVHLFAGAKELRLLTHYEDRYDIASFDRAINFGRLYFLAKPFFYCLDYLALLFKGTGYGFGLAILTFVVLLKLLFFPMQSATYRSMNRTKQLQPQIEEIKARFGDDKLRVQQETMALYKREKINPALGCLPIVVQIPVFLALYEVLYITIEMRHAPFFGWIHDLSAPDPSSVFNLFGLIPWTPPAALVIGAWPMAMGLTMYIQQKMTPAQVDPVQKRMFEMLPLVFTFTMSKLPAGLVIYWTWSNFLGIVQQYANSRMMKKSDPRSLARA